MFCKRALAALVCLFLFAAAAHAFSFSYGSFFTITSIRRTQDGVVLPLARKKYKNIRLLSAAVYRRLDACRETCSQEVSSVHFNIGDWRKAKTREGMLIADVEFDDQWAVTFLIFKNKNGFGVKPPEHFAFTDKTLKKQVHDALVRLAEENL